MPIARTSAYVRQLLTRCRRRPPQARTFVRITVVLLVLLLLQMGAVFGLVWSVVAANTQTKVSASNPVMNVKGTEIPVQVASSDFYVDLATGKLLARQPAAPNGTVMRRRLLQDGVAPSEASLQVSSADTFISSSGVTQLRTNPPNSVPSFTSRSTGTYSPDLNNYDDSALSASSSSRHLLQATGSTSGASYVTPGSIFAPICDWSSLDFYTPGSGSSGVGTRGRCDPTLYCSGSGKGDCMATISTGCATYLRNSCRLDHFLMQTQVTLLMAQAGNGDSAAYISYQSGYTGYCWWCSSLRAFVPSYWTQTVYGIVYVNIHTSANQSDTTYGACYSDMYRFYFNADRTSFVDLCMATTFFPFAMGGTAANVSQPVNAIGYPLSCTNGSSLTGSSGSTQVSSYCTNSFNGKSYYGDVAGCVENCPGGPYLDYTNLQYDSRLFDLPCRPGFKNITMKYGATFTVLSNRCILMLDGIDGNDNDPNFGFFRQFNSYNDGCNGCRGMMICDPQLRRDATVPAGTVGVPCSTFVAQTPGAGRRLLALPSYTLARTFNSSIACGNMTGIYLNGWYPQAGSSPPIFTPPTKSVAVLGNGVICLQNGDAAVATGGSVAATQSTSSDARLKTNLQKTGRSIGLLAEYTWEWNELAKSLGVDSPTLGVIAQEAQLVYPATVSMSAAGYLQVDYALLRELAQKDA